MVQLPTPQRSWNSVSQRNPSTLENTLNSLSRRNGGSIIRNSWRSSSRLLSRNSRLSPRSVVHTRTNSPPRSVVQTRTNSVTNMNAQPISVFGSCQDSTRITINKMSCPDLIAKEGLRVCNSPHVKSICCYSCSKYMK